MSHLPIEWAHLQAVAEEVSCGSPAPYFATIGADPVLAEADSLDTLLARVQAIHEPGRGESVALWRAPGTLVAVVLPDGSLLTIEAATSEGRATQ